MTNVEQSLPAAEEVSAEAMKGLIWIKIQNVASSLNLEVDIYNRKSSELIINETIKLIKEGGWEVSNDLVEEVFFRYFEDNEIAIVAEES